MHSNGHQGRIDKAGERRFGRLLIHFNSFSPEKERYDCQNQQASHCLLWRSLSAFRPDQPLRPLQGFTRRIRTGERKEEPAIDASSG